MNETEHANVPQPAATDAAVDAPNQVSEGADAVIDAQAFLDRIGSGPVSQALDELRALVSAQPQAALPVLTLLAQKAALELATHAMDMLAALRTQEAADALAPLGADRADAARAKAARRALHKLSLSGLKPAPTAPPPTAEPAPDKVYACLASAVDGDGTRSVTIARQNRFGTLSMAVFVLNESTGVVDAFGAVPCSMSLWKRYLADAETQQQVLVPVELAFCQRQIELAVARNERSKIPLPDRYYMLSSLAMGRSDERQRPAELSPEAIQAKADLLGQTTRLITLPECRTWLLPPDEMRPHALKLLAELRREQQQDQSEQRNVPVLDLSRVQKQGTIISMAMNTLFDGARRATFQDRLTYTADLLWRADRLEDAQLAMAAALALAPESTLPVEQHPFLREVVMASVLIAVQAEEAGASGAAAGAPAAAAGAVRPDAEEYVDAEGNIRRKSGLIIPR